MENITFMVFNHNKEFVCSDSRNTNPEDAKRIAQNYANLNGRCELYTKGSNDYQIFWNQRNRWNE